MISEALQYTSVFDVLSKHFKKVEKSVFAGSVNSTMCHSALRAAHAQSWSCLLYVRNEEDSRHSRRTDSIYTLSSLYMRSAYLEIAHLIAPPPRGRLAHATWSAQG